MKGVREGECRVVGGELSAIGIGFRLSAISFQVSAFGDRGDSRPDP
jgi:hypothetical protein